MQMRPWLVPRNGCHEIEHPKDGREPGAPGMGSECGDSRIWKTEGNAVLDQVPMSGAAKE
jgi:hypothetical protein